MKSSRSMGGLASAFALSCLLGLAPQQAGASVVLNGCAGGSFGDECSLAELVSSGSMFFNGTTLFSNFGLALFGGRPLNPDVIRVDTIDTLLNPGFRLVDTGGTLTAVNGDATFNSFFFDVAVTVGDLRIKDNSLVMAVGSLTGSGSATNVFETVFDAAFAEIGNKDAFCNAPSCANSMITDSALFSPVTALTVLMGIDVVADAAGTAQINSVTVQFSQVPEPGSLALLAFGLAGMGVSSRRRRQVAAG